MRAVVMKSLGGPEVLEMADVPEPTPPRAHRVINVRKAGVNFADTHVRTGTYLADIELPYTPGNEVMGVDDKGERVVALTRGGGYAEQVAMHRMTCWPVPDDVTDEQALAVTLQGNTAWHLLHTCIRLTSSDTVVVSAAAGGVGTLAMQLAAQAGARVIGLASTSERRALATELGASAVVDSRADDLTQAVLDAAGGPVTAVLEMTGGRVHEQLLATLAPLGRMAVYGYAGGTPAPASGRLLLERSLTVQGLWLPHLYSVRGALANSMKELFDAVAAGTLRPVIGQEWLLKQASDAHRALENRTVTGKAMLHVSN
ncbi:alcohol dehydrogenase [Streptomyces hygroscopicus]|uniref:quinone oxidoreductase family protein n=1 Tax=Streptomyces hygroscopicus TaxID=1912 RepID=UPI00223FE213|nr:zinc-binding dehydrogenase [Streptomyces hygroscopicus]MCW7941371.1 alcohol dehydrogenase [Streptomyces hygroscopicus]